MSARRVFVITEQESYDYEGLSEPRRVWVFKTKSAAAAALARLDMGGTNVYSLSISEPGRVRGTNGKRKAR
jgi:hypothetical protein